MDSALAPLRPFRTPVRGHAFASPPPGVRSPLDQQLAVLVREPDNPADPHAVAVWIGEVGRPWRIGYLDRGVAARVAPRMDAGMEFSARITGRVGEPDGRWQRPLLLVATARDGDDRDRSLWGRPPASRRRRVGPAGRPAARGAAGTSGLEHGLHGQ